MRRLFSCSKYCWRPQVTNLSPACEIKLVLEITGILRHKFPLRVGTSKWSTGRTLRRDPLQTRVYSVLKLLPGPQVESNICNTTFEILDRALPFLSRQWSLPRQTCVLLNSHVARRILCLASTDRGDSPQEPLTIQRRIPKD